VLPMPRDSVQRAHRVPRGFPDRQAYLRLDLGEDDTPASPRVAEVLSTLDPSAYSHYPNAWPLRGKLAELHDLPVEWTSVTAGTDEALRLVFHSFVEEGARVLLPRPSAGAYLAAAESGGAFVERVDYNDDLSFPTEAFRKQMLARTPRLAVLGNPGSPVGSAIPLEDLLQLPTESPRTLFLVDEVYVAYHGRTILAPEVRDRLPPNIIVLRSFSKDYGLAGLRIGYLIGRPELLRSMDVVKPSYTIAAPSLHAAVASLEDRESMLNRVATRRALALRLIAAVSVRGIEARPTQSAFVLIKLTAPIRNWAAAFAAHKILLGTRGHVGALAPWIRVTVTSEEDIERFLEVLDLVLRQGVAGASRVEGVPGDWDEKLEGMA
jgi:histidinol-phosphate aminotransferase